MEESDGNENQSRLYYPTISFISSQLKLQEEQEKKEQEYKPFIGEAWNKRAPSAPRERRNSEATALSSPEKREVNPKYADVPSKLHLPTSSTISAQTLKHKEKLLLKEIEEENQPPPVKLSPKPVDPNSSLLIPTAAAINATWRVKGSEPEQPSQIPVPVSQARKLSLKTGPANVDSKLYQNTKALENARWKSKEELEAEAAAKAEEELSKYKVIGGDKKVSKISSHILTPTKALEHGKRSKIDQVDPRESGWKVAPKKANLMSSPPPPLPGTSASNRLDSSSSEYDGNSVVSSLTNNSATPSVLEKQKSLKVAAPSSRLLAPTIGNQYARYKAPENERTTPKKAPAVAPPLSPHLLTPTIAHQIATASFAKAEVEVDPREKGWNDKFHIDPKKSSPKSSYRFSDVSMASIGSVDSRDGMSRDGDNLTYMVDQELSPGSMKRAVSLDGKPISSSTTSRAPSRHRKSAPMDSATDETPTNNRAPSRHRKNSDGNGSSNADTGSKPRAASRGRRSASIDNSVTTTLSTTPNPSRKESTSAKTKQSPSQSPQNEVSHAITHLDIPTIEGQDNDVESEQGDEITDQLLSFETLGLYDDRNSPHNKKISSQNDVSEDNLGYDYGKTKSFRWARTGEGGGLKAIAAAAELNDTREIIEGYDIPKEISAHLLKPTAASEHSKWTKPINSYASLTSNPTTSTPAAANGSASFDSPGKLMTLGSSSSTSGSVASDKDGLFQPNLKKNPLQTPRKKPSISSNGSSGVDGKPVSPETIPEEPVVSIPSPISSVPTHIYGQEELEEY